MTGVGMLLMGGSMFVFQFDWSFYSICGFWVLYTFGEMIFSSMSQFICYRSASYNKKASSVGLNQSAYALSTIIGASGGSWLYHHQSPSFLWNVLGAIALIGLLSTLVFKKNKI